MKKIIVLLSLVLVFSLVACGNNTNETKTEKEVETTQETSVENNETNTETEKELGLRIVDKDSNFKDEELYIAAGKAFNNRANTILSNDVENMTFEERKVFLDKISTEELEVLLQFKDAKFNSPFLKDDLLSYIEGLEKMIGNYVEGENDANHPYNLGQKLRNEAIKKFSVSEKYKEQISESNLVHLQKVLER